MPQTAATAAAPSSYAVRMKIELASMVNGCHKTVDVFVPAFFRCPKIKRENKIHKPQKKTTADGQRPMGKHKNQ